MPIWRESESKRWLAARGLPVPAGAEVSDAAAAEALAARLGYPLVCKLSLPDLAHKSERGGVVLDVRDLPTLRAAVSRLCAAGGPDAGVLVERQVPAGVELIVSARRDPVLGPAVLLGLGGLYTEVLRDTVVRVGPVDPPLARAMLAELRGAALLYGFRGQPAVDLAAVAAIVANVSAALAERPDLTEIELNPVIAGPAGAVIVDAKVTSAPAPPPVVARAPAPPPVAPFFEAHSVAVVGASPDPGKGGHLIVQNLLGHGFSGRIVPVHPRAGAILGLPAYPTLSAIPGGVELAVVIVPKDQVAGVVRDAAAAGVHHLIVATAGFADLGPQGAAEQAELLAFAAAHGIRIMGPNSIGVVNAQRGLVTSIVTLERLRPGPIALFGQSGTFASGYANWFATRGRPAVGKIACLGNKGAVDEVDLLDYFGADSETRVLALYTEGVANPAFAETLLAVARRKPVVVLKSGRTAAGRAAVASHTGSLAGDDALFSALLRQAGALQVADLDDLWLTADACATLPRPRGPRVGVVSITGLGCVLSADAVGEFGLELLHPAPATLVAAGRFFPPWAPVRNPFDIWAAIEKHGAAAAVGGIAAAVLADPGCDALILNLVLFPESRLDVPAFAAELRELAPEKPVVVVIYGGALADTAAVTREFEAGGILVAPGPRAAARVLARLLRLGGAPAGAYHPAHP